MFIYPRDAADLKLCLPIPSFLLTKVGIRIRGLVIEPALYAGFVPPADFGYSRAREYAESGSAVSRFLMTVLR